MSSAVGISKPAFLAGLVIAIVASSCLSMVVSSQLSFGPKGDKGDKGDQGSQGPQGIQGIQGIQGSQGIQGIKGDKGDTGPQGPLGTFTIGDIAGLMPTPAYDSGWIPLQQAQWIPVQHNLDTTDLLVYVLGKQSADGQINQLWYVNSYMQWRIYSKDAIELMIQFDTSDLFRVMLWKIAQP